MKTHFITIALTAIIIAGGCSSGQETSDPSPEPEEPKACPLPLGVDDECFNRAECVLLYVTPCDGGMCWNGRCVH